MEGTGLGLNIVRETIESIGGRAWVEFDQEGTVFKFCLPAPADAPELPDEAGPPQARGPR